MAVAGDEPIEGLHQPIHDREPPEGGDGTEPWDSGRHLENGFAAGNRGAVRPEHMKCPGQLT
jgi:hypothetical protein